ncbi:MAG: magnesium transporter CorA [Variovorax sp.]|nr:MAG: magnesium transporter CorA [Variovorax sp.]
MRIFEIHGSQVNEHPALAPLARPGACRGGYLWLSLTRSELRAELAAVQPVLEALCGTQLLDLHVSDLLNDQLPSHYDYTSRYDVLVLRRLAAGALATDPAGSTATTLGTPAAGPVRGGGGPPVLRRVDTRPVGFAVFDRVLLSVHPEDGAVRDAYAQKLLAAVRGNGNGSGAREGSGTGTPALDVRAVSARVPTSPADLMLRLANQIVDGYLDLRRQLTKQLDHWQAELIDPKSRFTNWSALMDARQSLHHLDEICEDQRAALQDWIDALETLPVPESAAEAREHELVLVRSRDVLEHIERVVHHVRRLEQNAETAVQMHFSVQSHRTNDIMRVLTVLTAVFLPLNLIAGIFGMNFEFIPLVHKADGFWIAMGSMGFTAVALVGVFWRKRYLARTAR